MLFVITTPLFASIDFKIDFNNPPEIMPYKFQGTKDNNGDGKPDEMYYKEGNMELLIEDADFDGNMDAVTYYEDEVSIKKEVDIDKDGKLDRRFWYKEGEVERIEKVSEKE